MLITFVTVYIIATVGIGLWAASRVHNTKDFIVAGRSLPLYMSIAVVFATWFGAETVLSVSATFARDGLGGVVADPFGASFCLIFVGLFFAKAFYRLDVLTIGDFYRRRYGQQVEVLTSLAITISYLGWTSAQLTAIGLVFSVLSDGAITINQGILMGAGIVLFYTVWGGMWSVAFTDLFQSVVIVIGLWALAWIVSDMAGGAGTVIVAAIDAGKFQFWPEGGTKEWLAFAAAWMTLALGSIPQQDVFQRVTSAKSESVAVKGTLIGGVVYFFFAFVPIFITYAALVVDPQMSQLFASEDDREIQRILPQFVLSEGIPMWAKVMFFGALMSAILSSASGALLAPSALFTANALRPFVPHMSDRQFLLTLRLVLVSFTLAATVFALNSTSTMYEMVQNAYKVTLSGAFVPLVAGIFWKRANNVGALAATVLGISAWLLTEWIAPEGTWPPQLVGLAVSTVAMIAGSYAMPAPHPHANAQK